MLFNVQHDYISSRKYGFNNFDYCINALSTVAMIAGDGFLSLLLIIQRDEISSRKYGFSKIDNCIKSLSTVAMVAGDGFFILLLSPTC